MDTLWTFSPEPDAAILSVMPQTIPQTTFADTVVGTMTSAKDMVACMGPYAALPAMGIVILTFGIAVWDMRNYYQCKIDEVKSDAVKDIAVLEGVVVDGRE